VFEVGFIHLSIPGYPTFFDIRGDYKYHSEYHDIKWDDKSIISSDPRTAKTKLQV
jgi:hypothetical protein